MASEASHITHEVFGEIRAGGSSLARPRADLLGISRSKSSISGRNAMLRIVGERRLFFVVRDRAKSQREFALINTKAEGPNCLPEFFKYSSQILGQDSYAISDAPHGDKSGEREFFFLSSPQSYFPSKRVRECPGFLNFEM